MGVKIPLLTRFKLLIVDLDGTLSPNLGMPPQEFIPSRCLINSVKKGLKQLPLSLCTGREPETVLKIVKKLNLTSPQIIEGGAKIIDPKGKILWVKYIEKNSIIKLFNYLNKRVVSYSMIVDGREIMDEIPTNNLDKTTAVLVYNLSYTEEQIFNDVFSSAKDITVVINKDRKGKTHYITHKLGTKSHGVRKLQEILNISKQETIGIGDGKNDIPLLNECGLKVAMGNSDSDLKSISDVVAPSVDEDGVAYVIEKFVLGK